MPRRAKVIIKDVPYHIVQRGNYLQRVFDSVEDKDYYIKCFQKYRAQFKIKLYSCCLMDNHIHFIIEPSTQEGLGLLFKRKVFTLYKFKKNHGGGHLYEAIRYVELTPLRVRMESVPVLFRAFIK